MHPVHWLKILDGLWICRSFFWFACSLCDTMFCKLSYFSFLFHYSAPYSYFLTGPSIFQMFSFVSHPPYQLSVSKAIVNLSTRVSNDSWIWFMARQMSSCWFASQQCFQDIFIFHWWQTECCNVIKTARYHGGEKSVGGEIEFVIISKWSMLMCWAWQLGHLSSNMIWAKILSICNHIFAAGPGNLV